MTKIFKLILISFTIVNIAWFVMGIAEVRAEKEPIYSAGNKNGDICECPVPAGNCVCKWNPPQ